MLQMLRCFTSIALALITLAPALCCQPQISGDLSGSLGPGTFIVVGNCNVPAGQSLTIQPATTLLFAGHYFFNVYGELHAEGTATDSIVLTRQFEAPEYQHGGLRFQTGSSLNNTLAYCEVSYARNVDFPNLYGGGMLIMDAGISATHCTFMHCSAHYGGGVYVYNAQATFSNCRFENNAVFSRGGGLYAIGSSILIDSCIFWENQADLVAGIVLYDNDDAEVRNCIVAYGRATSTAG